MADDENLDDDYSFEDDIQDDIDDDLRSASPEELLKIAQSERKQRTKIAEDYKGVEKQRNQMESLLGNVKEGLEESGVASMSLVGDKVRIEVKGGAKEKEVIAQSPEEARLSELNQAEKSLKEKRKNDEVDDDDYIEKLSEIKAQRALEQHKIDNKLNSEKNQLQQTKDKWVADIQKDFPDAANKNSELFQEMNRIAKPNVNYMDNLSQYYELAERAKERIQSRAKKGSDNMINDEFASESNNSVSGGSHDQSQRSESFLDSKDKSFIEINIRKDAVKRVEHVFSQNMKKGTVTREDKYLMSSNIFMES